MNYKEFAEHTEHYLIGEVNYEVTANFVTNIIMIKGPLSFNKVSMDEYMKFEGTMEEFTAVVVGESK